MNIIAKILQYNINPELFGFEKANQLKFCNECLMNFFNMFSFPVIITDTEYKPVLSNKNFVQEENLNRSFIQMVAETKNWRKADILDENDDTIGYFFFRDDYSCNIYNKDATSSLGDTLKYFLEKSSDVIWQCDIFLNAIFVSSSIHKFLGYTPEEFKQLNWEKIFYKEHAKLIFSTLETALKDYESGKPINEEYLFELKFKHKQGFEKWGEVKANPVFDKNDKLVGIQGIIRDITEKKMKEDEIFKLKKLEALGTLASGIAHDFNNILTGILGNVSLAKLNMKKDDRTFYLLENAEKAVERARIITSQLLTFSKGGEPVIEKINIKDIIVDYVKFLLSGRDIKPVFSIDKDLWLTNIDKSQFLIVIQNIVLNACEASPPGGTIEISCKNYEINPENEKFPMIGNNYIEIKVSDQGVGIDESKREKIFEPFYTTKKKQSGLGLSIAYSILKRHSGYIFFSSEVGEGTTFYIYIPAEKTKSEDKKKSTNIKDILKDKKILIMDDELSIRELLYSILTMYNAKVISASNGNEALRFYKNIKGIDVVITDLTVPGGMGGKELIENILKIDKNAKVIVSSGYSSDPIMQNYKNYGFSNVLPKPFKVNEVLSILKETLSE